MPLSLHSMAPTLPKLDGLLRFHHPTRISKHDWRDGRCLASLFFLRTTGMEVSHRSCAPATQKTPSPRQDHLNLSSLITSCIDGTFPVHGTGRRSTSDPENALTMLHAGRELHLRNHAVLARSWRIKGTVSARALANPCKNWEVSLDHLPFFFFLRKMETESKVSTRQGSLVYQPENRSSAITSELEGVGPSAPSPPRNSNKDEAKDLDALQARIELHLRNQA